MPRPRHNEMSSFQNSNIDHFYLPTCHLNSGRSLESQIHRALFHFQLPNQIGVLLVEERSKRVRPGTFSAETAWQYPSNGFCLYTTGKVLSLMSRKAYTRMLSRVST